MVMSNLYANMVKAAPIMFKTSMMTKDHFMATGIVSKQFSYAIAKPGYNNWKFGPVVKGRSKNELSIIPQFSVYGHRFSTTNAPPDPIPPSPNQSPTPSNFSNKKQMEKVFFRTVAFFWDNGGNFFTWSREMFKTHVIEIPSVQFYWKRFHDKMDEAKKNDL